MEWVEITVEDVLAHMPTDVKVRYEAWLGTNPDRSGRLAEITANTLREFRDNLKSVQANIVDPRETWVPRSAVRHIETIIVFSLAMEMGLPVDSAGQGARYAADIFLRQILMGRYRTTTPEAGEPSPLFSIPDRSGISGRALPLVLALLLFAGRATAGWIRPDSAPPLDTQVVATFVPSAYSISASTLYGHLHGIDAALDTKATTTYVDAAVAGISITNTVDPTARALAETASLSANAAITALPNYLPLSGGTLTGPLWLYWTNRLYIGRSSDGTTETRHFEVFQGYQASRSMPFMRFTDTLASVPVSTGTVWYATNRFHFNQLVHAPTVSAQKVFFPAGDYLSADGTNLFYVTADRATTNNLTGN